MSNSDTGTKEDHGKQKSKCGSRKKRGWVSYSQRGEPVPIQESFPTNFWGESFKCLLRSFSELLQTNLCYLGPVDAVWLQFFYWNVYQLSLLVSLLHIGFWRSSLAFKWRRATPIPVIKILHKTTIFLRYPGLWNWCHDSKGHCVHSLG